MRLNGRPLVVVWVSFTVSLDVWRTIFANLRARGRDASYLALGFDAGPLEVFDGLHQYGTAADLANSDKRGGRAARYYPLLSNDPTPKIWAPSAEPGYDDRRIPGRKGVVVDRSNGDFYRQTLDAAAGSDPDWILITSWNEWWEHTYIEPSRLYGETYLEITREFANRWKGY